MPKFQNREEYERWKSEKLKNKEGNKSVDKEQITNAVENQENQTTKKVQPFRLSKKWIIVVIAILVSFTSIAIFLYLYIYDYKPRSIAEKYLKVVQLHDFEKIMDISLRKARSDALSDGILINLIDWKFIDSQKITNRKEKLGLSEEAFERDVKSVLDLYKADSVKNLPDHRKDQFKDYEAWKSYYIRIVEAFKENGNYYFYYDIPQIEYLLDITATNKLGMELKKKYILRVEKQDDGWKVVKFDER